MKKIINHVRALLESDGISEAEKKHLKFQLHRFITMCKKMSQSGLDLNSNTKNEHYYYSD